MRTFKFRYTLRNGQAGSGGYRCTEYRLCWHSGKKEVQATRRCAHLRSTGGA